MGGGIVWITRGSDAVDLGLDLAPRRWVRTLLLALIVLMGVTGWYEPVLWYVRDKAAGITESLLPAFEGLANTDTPARAP
ncbi:hypothetical protein [Actinotalea subterranea]|uniref:hypothetical protein n=1 Tax=Actinotalea subterranea TaxID=2607497 RepID=UPI00165E5099|nr:hypothetical protein [Actinotalea subterranea]